MQGTLFDDPPPNYGAHTLHRLARATDPVTSQASGQAIADSGTDRHQARLAAAMVKANSGLTCQEIAAADDRLDEHQLGRRLKQAESMGLVRRGDVKRCAITGRSATTWRSTEGGE